MGVWFVLYPCNASVDVGKSKGKILDKLADILLKEINDFNGGSYERRKKGIKFGETVADGNGNKYTKTIGGWIYTTFSGQVCFIPEGTRRKTVTEKADKKAKEKIIAYLPLMC